MCLTTDKSQPAVNETIVELQWILLKSDNNVVTVSNKEKKKNLHCDLWAILSLESFTQKIHDH